MKNMGFWIAIIVLVLIIFFLYHRNRKHKKIVGLNAASVYGSNPTPPLTLPATGYVALTPPLANSDGSIIAYYSYPQTQQVPKSTLPPWPSNILYDKDGNIILDLSKFGGVGNIPVQPTKTPQ